MLVKFVLAPLVLFGICVLAVALVLLCRIIVGVVLNSCVALYKYWYFFCPITKEDILHV